MKLLMGRKSIDRMEIPDGASLAHKKLIEGHNRGLWILRPFPVNRSWLELEVKGGMSGVKYTVQPTGQVVIGSYISLCSRPFFEKIACSEEPYAYIFIVGSYISSNEKYFIDNAGVQRGWGRFVVDWLHISTNRIARTAILLLLVCIWGILFL
jgi:hypothetical protein